MSEMSLERRCRWVARAYPEAGRRAEVVATLMDSNTGRSTPRLADVTNVAWHGLVARLRREPAPGTRFGRLGDLLAVAVVGGIVAFAATAVVMLTTAVVGPVMPYYHQPAYILYWPEVVAAAVASVVALAAAWFAARGRTALTRLLVVVAGVTGFGIWVLERAIDEPWSFTTFSGRRLALVGAVVLVSAVSTGAVARSALVVAASWWRVVFLCAVLAGRYVVDTGSRPFGYGRAALALGVLVAVSVVVALLVVPVTLAPRPDVATD